MRTHFKDMITGTSRRYGAAVVVVALALILRGLIAPLIGDTSPYMFVLTAVVISAWYGAAGRAWLPPSSLRSPQATWYSH